MDRIERVLSDLARFRDVGIINARSDRAHLQQAIDLVEELRETVAVLEERELRAAGRSGLLGRDMAGDPGPVIILFSSDGPIISICHIPDRFARRCRISSLYLRERALAGKGYSL